MNIFLGTTTHFIFHYFFSKNFSIVRPISLFRNQFSQNANIQNIIKLFERVRNQFYECHTSHFLYVIISIRIQSSTHISFIQEKTVELSE